MVDEITEDIVEEVEKGICNIRTVFEDKEVSVTHVISLNDNINNDNTYVITIDNNSETANIQRINGYGTSEPIVLETYEEELQYNILTMELEVGTYTIISTPSSLDYNVNSLTFTVTNETYEKNNTIIRVENDIEIILSKCGEIVSKSCKYFHHDPYMTPNNYDLYFNYAEIPVNVIKESPSDLQMRLQRKLPLSKILHLNLETENTPKSNNVNILSHTLLRYYTDEGNVNGGYLTIQGTWDTNSLNNSLKTKIFTYYNSWVNKYLIGEIGASNYNLATYIDEEVNYAYYLSHMDDVVSNVKEGLYEIVLNKPSNMGIIEQDSFEADIREQLQFIIDLFLYDVNLEYEQYIGNENMEGEDNNDGYNEWYIMSTRAFIDTVIEYSSYDDVEDVNVYLYQNGICLNPKIEDSTDSNVIKVGDSYEIIITLTEEEYDLLFNGLDVVWFIIDGVSQGFKTMHNEYLEYFYLTDDDFIEVDGSYVSSFSIIAEKLGDYEITPVLKPDVEEAELDSFEISVVEEFPTTWEKPIVLTEENNWRVTLLEILPFYEETDGVVDYDKIISYTVESDNPLCGVNILPLDKSYLNPVEFKLL